MRPVVRPKMGYWFFPPPLAQQRLRELSGVKSFQVFKFFAHADEVDRHRSQCWRGLLPLARPQCNGGQHASLGGGVGQK